LGFANSNAADSHREGKTISGFYLQNYIRLYESLLDRPLVRHCDRRHQFPNARRHNLQTVLHAPHPDRTTPNVPAVLPLAKANAFA
jgi:hypothetical protein